MLEGKNYASEVARLVSHYSYMKDLGPVNSMYRETMWQYGDMAHGGDGGPTGSPDGKTIREEYYPGYPDKFFFEVLSLLGESETYLSCGEKANA